MTEPQIDESRISGANPSAPRLGQAGQKSNTVRQCYEQVGKAVLTAVLFLGALALVRHYYYPLIAVQESSIGDLQKQVHELAAEVEQLKREQSIPARVLNQYRNSIGYIYGVYQVGFANQPAVVRAQISGTGFLVGDGLVATNRHVAEPWYGDSASEALIHRGASTTLESLVVFFPGSRTSVKLSPASVSKTSDLAILRAADLDAVRGLPALPLAKAPSPTGQLVTVMGYPMGVAGMVAKSPTGVYDRLAYRHNDISLASKLAALSLIRPFVTYGHLSDIVGDKLIYDAPTAHGGSGGPVLNANGEVIGVNFAYMNGFSGAALGISAESLRPLLEEAQKGR